MNITLKVSTEALKTKASEVENDIKQLENHFNGIQDILSRSVGYWIGIAGDKARKEFDSKKEDTNMVIRRFREHPGELLAMAGVYEEGERSALEANRALDTDIIA